MSDGKLRLTQDTISGLKYRTQYAVAQVPTHKDEDTWAVYDGAKHGFGNMAGAVFMVCDGHGGKHAAAMCQKQLIMQLKESHTEVASNLDTAGAEGGDRPQKSLKAKLADRNNWMGNGMDTAIEEAFRVMDLEVKRYTTAGTTCSVVICRDDPLDDTELSSADPSVMLKCAWVGDSRCTRALMGPKGYEECEDMSRDHRPDMASELSRLNESVHGAVDLSKDVIVVEQESVTPAGLRREMSVRNATGSIEPIGNTFNKISESLSVHGGVKICYDTPGFPVESSVHGTSRHSGRKAISASMHGPRTAKAGDIRARAAVPIRSNGSLSSKHKAQNQGDSTNGSLRSNSGSSQAAPTIKRAVSESVINTQSAMGQSDSDSDSFHGEKSNKMQRELSGKSGMLVVTENVATSFEEDTTAVVSPDGVKILQSESVSLQQQRTTRRAQSDGGAAQLGIAEKALEAAAAAAAMRTTDPGNDSDALFFVGRLQAGGVTSGRRVFSTNGGSTAFTRSIGDRDAGAVIISKPEINTVEVPVQPGTRCIIGSDGLWDVFTTPEAHKVIAKLEPGKAASKLATEAKTRRTYRGFSPDDITVMVIDITDQSAVPVVTKKGQGKSVDTPMAQEAPGCKCVTM